MEYLDIVDENNKFTNEVKSRRIVHEKGLWHREVAIWVIKDKNKVLIQKRAASKKFAPNMWTVAAGHIAAGHIAAGEPIIKAAIREVSEELGIKNIGPSDLKLIHVQKCEQKGIGELRNNIYKYIYVLQTDLEETDFVIQKEELSEIKYVKLEELKDLRKTKFNMEKYTSGFFQAYTKELISKIEEFLKEEN